MRSGRLVLVSNRLPITVETVENNLRIRPSSGGLVTALLPILRENGGCWLGWTGTDYEPQISELLNSHGERHSYSLHPVFMSAAEKQCFYNGCSNQVIWPLFHGLSSCCQFDSAYWQAYRCTNEKFAAEVAQMRREGDFIWVQDYHLMLAGQCLRRRGLQDRTAYFHHIPFPPPDVFELLPWRYEVLTGLMHYDVIGFQTSRDVQNFISCVRRFLPAPDITNFDDQILVSTDGLCAAVGRYPVSIDFNEFTATSKPTKITAATIAQNTRGMKVLLGVDRLDYTKGILQRLAAFRTLLASHPEWHGRVTMLQIVIPSREDVPEYQRLKLEIERRISEINGQYSSPAWTPVHYFHRTIPRDELIGFYRAADVAVVTPLRDGMNLVAKEFCAARTDNRGVLVLSEFAGAAEELATGALLVNPNDTDAIAYCLYSALTMDDSEQKRRMSGMRAIIRSNDVFRWANSFVRAALGVADDRMPIAARMAGD